MKPEERAAVLADPFVRHYLATMLQDLQNSEQQEAAEGEREPRDAGSVHQLPDQLLADAKADCDGFRAACGPLLAQADQLHGYREAQAGSDFWLTRVGHGAGYWDRGLGQIGQQLTALCGHGTPYGNLDPVLGDDGRVYLA